MVAFFLGQINYVKYYIYPHLINNHTCHNYGLRNHQYSHLNLTKAFRSSRSEVFLVIEITLQHARFSVNLLHIFKTPFPKNTSGWLLLQQEYQLVKDFENVKICLFQTVDVNSILKLLLSLTKPLEQ